MFGPVVAITVGAMTALRENAKMTRAKRKHNANITRKNANNNAKRTLNNAEVCESRRESGAAYALHSRELRLNIGSRAGFLKMLFLVNNCVGRQILAAAAFQAASMNPTVQCSPTMGERTRVLPLGHVCDRIGL